MTATWTTIPDASLEPGKPARSVDALALRDNPVAIAERATDAPIVQVPVLEKLTAASGNWTWPDGVTAATFWIQAPGGGGGGNTTNGSDGANSTITYDSITTTAEGGKGGTKDGVAFADGEGGSLGGGDFSVNGKAGRGANGGDSFFGEGHLPSSALGPEITATKGGGGKGSSSGGSGQGGGGGEMVRKRVIRVDGLNTVAYVNGAGGAAGTGGNASSGASGLIVIEY